MLVTPAFRISLNICDRNLKYKFAIELKIKKKTLHTNYFLLHLILLYYG